MTTTATPPSLSSVEMGNPSSAKPGAPSSVRRGSLPPALSSVETGDLSPAQAAKPPSSVQAREHAGKRPLRPPSYVNVPTSVGYAPVPDAFVVTMVRILGLCWSNNYRRTPALTLDQLAGLLDRPRTTLHRHLDILEHDLGWLRRERQDRRFILCPLHPSAEQQKTGASAPKEHANDPEEPERDDAHTCAPGTSVAAEPLDSDCSCSHRTSVSSENAESCSFAPEQLPGEGRRPSPELLRILADVGIESPARERIASDPAVEPAWVPAWQLWAQHPARANLSNPAGYIVRRLLSRSRPPELYLRLVRLTSTEKAQLRCSYWTGGDDLEPDLQAVRTLYIELFKDQIRG